MLSFFFVLYVLAVIYSFPYPLYLHVRPFTIGDFGIILCVGI